MKRRKRKKFNFYLFILIIFLIIIAFLIYKNITYKKMLESNEINIGKINNKISKEEEVYYDEKEVNELKDVAASKLTECMKKSTNVDDLPSNIKDKIKKIKDYFNTSNNYVSFKYEDIFSGFTVSYNENQSIFAASTIKAPVDIYIYEKAAEGEIDLTKELKYTSDYYNTGTGVLKNKSYKNYPIKELLSYSIMYSDNAAHNMLMNYVGREKY